MNLFQSKMINVERRIVDLFNKAKYYAIDTFNHYKNSPMSLKVELLSGITVAVMQVPESIAFSFIAGIPPIIGLYSTFFMGLITGAFGGKPAMISGIAGAMVVVLRDITLSNGLLSFEPLDERLEVAFVTMIFCGVLQMLAAFAKLGKFVNMIGKGVMIGFMNGLGIVIFMGQLDSFRECSKDDINCSFEKKESLRWIKIDDPKLYIMFLYIICTMVIMKFLPKLKRVGKIIPASLVGLIIGTIFEHTINRPYIGYDVRTVGETSPVGGELPQFHLPRPQWTNDKVMIVIQYSASLAAVGLIESIMTLQACNSINGGKYSEFKNNQECFAQGLANLISGLFGSVGGDAMIGQSVINSMNGARGRLSAITASLFILLFIFIAGPIIELIPIASLTGVLFIVVISTINWTCIPRYYYKIIQYLLQKYCYCYRKNDIYNQISIPWQKIIVITVVTIFAVLTNLAIAVVIGVAIETLIFAYYNLHDFHKKDIEIIFRDTIKEQFEIENPDYTSDAESVDMTITLPDN